MMPRADSRAYSKEVNHDDLDEQITLRVATRDLTRIDDLVDLLLQTRSGVVRAALRLGLDVLESDPSLLLRAHRERRERARRTSDY